MKKYFALSVLVLFMFSCKEQTKSNKEPTITEEKNTDETITELPKGTPFTNKIEKAHKKDLYIEKEAISFDLAITFGGKDAFKGRLTQLTNGTKIRIDYPDNSKLVYDNKEVFICPKDANTDRSRFEIFTWSYFFGLPYKLNDPGTFWEAPMEKQIDGKPTQTAKLSFTDGTGDAPDDWYVVYQNSENGSLAGAAYIVSFGKDKAKAEENPHAIKFNNYEMVDGIPIATKWTFHNWNETDGFGDQIGEATLTNIKFLNATKTLFNRPEDSKTVPLTSK